jgi:iron complex outermembrane recepter protein
MKYAIISLFMVIFSPGYSQVAGRLIDTSTVEPVARALIIPLSRNLSEVNITAYHTPDKLRTVAGAVSVIELSPLQKSGYNIVSSLNGIPGLNIQEATPGTMKLTLRGIGSRYPYGTRKIKMFFDGIPLYSAEGETYFDEISPEYIGRIEILRGPASSVYGASLGGTLLLYPERSSFRQSEAGIFSSLGSFGYVRNTLKYEGSIGGNDLLLALSHMKSDGYRENSKYERKSVFINYNHPFGSKLTGSLLLAASSVKSQIPSSVDSVTYFTNPAKAAPLWLKTKGNKNPDRVLTGLKINYRASDKWDILGSVFSTFRINEENRPFNFLNEADISYGGRILARYLKNAGQMKYIFTGGTNLFFEHYKNIISENSGGLGLKGVMLQRGKESIYQADLFSQVEIKLSELTVAGGFSLNKSGFRFTDGFSIDTVNQSGSYRFNPVFSPRLSVSWNPAKDVSLYAAVNKGFTMPSLSETMTPAGLINRNIKPEKAWSYEAGLRMSFFSHRSFIDLALYTMHVTDLIVPKRVEEDFYVGMNAGASLHKGIELALQQWLWGRGESNGKASSSAVLNLSYSASRFSFLDFTVDGNDFSGNSLPGIPDHYFTGSLDLKTISGIYTQVEVLSSGEIPLDDFNSCFADPWTLMNVKLGYSFTLKNNFTIDLMSALNNITNTKYASMVVVNAPGSALRPPRYYYPGMPFWLTFNVGLKYRFKTG